MSTWLANAIVRGTDVSDWLSEKRQAALGKLKQQSWPNRKTEAWKYTPVSVIDRGAFSPAVNDVDANAAIDAIDNLDASALVFLNGRYCEALSCKTLPEGVSITSFHNASAAQKEWALAQFASVKPDRHLFGLINDVLAEDGLLIDVEPGVQVTTLLRVVNLFSEGIEAHSRILVRVGKGAKLAIAEEFTNSTPSLNTSFAEYVIEDNAELEHYRFALQTGSALSVGGGHFKLHDHSKLHSTLVGFGSQLSRVDVDIEHAGQHAYAEKNVVYLLDGKEIFDLHSTIEHAKPNGTTEENVRGIVADQAKVVFNGRIHIHRDAQKTLAELNNRNLLLSRKAEVNTKPELEIYADDVRCAHGATVAELDTKALYYLQSRGVSRQDAQIMLNFGFINELVDRMPNEALATWLRSKLKVRFAQMKVSSPQDALVNS
ncbi:Fe-S cluster assembly protein SufD [Marinibactrum halimedae]|uniref:Fe-S cluster assembly protein SufD n=1 Tax=Marinibactrum halimedae TaxID=1444977 RepID=A0AA37T232_9GAMM|nr:Fe-S cluster assembly protein SufD [Marinibactrum halimedae]MCD9457734.1 Fe-S cluster assembly protein SufD [Marinibactrum halimedae]GLS24893.1 Fe-S cluster assembly protein SufD [Marinibactrum halimedae]